MNAGDRQETGIQSVAVWGTARGWVSRTRSEWGQGSTFLRSRDLLWNVLFNFVYSVAGDACISASGI